MYRKFQVAFDRGLRKKGSPRFFNDGECSIAQDCYFDDVGSIFSRKFIGVKYQYVSDVKTIAQYNEKIVCSLENGHFYYNITHYMGSGLGSSRLSYVIYNDLLYLGSLYRFNGSVLQEIGNAKPTTAPTVAVENLEISDCNTAWTPSANVTASVDEHDYQNNPDDEYDIKSSKLEIADAFATGLIAYEDFASIDLSGYTHLGFWCKSNKSVDSGVLEILLDNTAGCVSPIETRPLPALYINRWQWCVVTITTPLSATAVISVGLNADSDPGVLTVKLDRIIAMKSGSLDGQYYYKYTYEDWTGNESSATDPSVMVYAKDEPVKIDVVASAVSKVGRINLYRLGGTLSDWYLVEKAKNITATLTDDTADSDLTTLFDAEYNDEMPTGLTYLAEHYERVIGGRSDDYENAVYYSKEYRPEIWSDTRQYLISNKDACTGLLSWGRYIIFCKKGKIFVLEGSNPEAWHERKSDSTYGNIAPWALTFYKIPIFLSYFGLYFFNGNNEQSFSEKIKDFFIENRDYLESSMSAIHDDKLYLAVNENVLVYDFILKIFYTYKLNLTEIRSIDDDLYAGKAKALIILEQGVNSHGETLSMQLKSKAFALNEIPNEIGELRNIIVTINTNGEDVSLNIYIDEVLKQQLVINTSSLERIRRGLNPQRGRYVEFEFVYSGKKQIEINPPLLVNEYE